MTGEKHAPTGNDSIQERGLLSLLIYCSINDAAYIVANRSIESSTDTYIANPRQTAPFFLLMTFVQVLIFYTIFIIYSSEKIH